MKEEKHPSRYLQRATPESKLMRTHQVGQLITNNRIHKMCLQLKLDNLILHDGSLTHSLHLFSGISKCPLLFLFCSRDFYQLINCFFLIFTLSSIHFFRCTIKRCTYLPLCNLSSRTENFEMPLNCALKNQTIGNCFESEVNVILIKNISFY